MRKVYFKISSTHYFTILNYLYHNLSDEDINILNNNCLKIKDEYLFRKLNCVEITRDYLLKMLKCCGNVIFNQEVNYYFAKPEEAFPTLLYFHYVFRKNYQKEELLKQISELMKQQLEEFEHEDTSYKFLILKNKELFTKEEQYCFKTLIHFLNTFYKQKKSVVKIKRRTNV